LEIILVIVGAVGLFLYNLVKKRSAESLLENLEVKQKINEQDEELVKKLALKDAESVKRQTLIDALEKDKGRKLTNKELVEFFND
jgi:hypothetical protein